MVAMIVPAEQQESVVSDYAAELGVDIFDRTALRRAEDKSTIGIAEVKNWQQALFRTSRKHNRLAVIYEADRLTPEASNGLLKVLEEPPANLFILLLLSRDNLLPTIKSRVFMRPFRGRNDFTAGQTVLPNNVSGIIDMAEGASKNHTVSQLLNRVLNQVRADLAAGKIKANAAGEIQQIIERYRPGMNGRLIAETVLLKYLEGQHVS